MEWSPVLFAVGLVVAVYYYDQNLKMSQQGLSAESQVIHVWKKTIKEPKEKVKRIAVGLNVNADLVVPAIALLDELNVKQGSRKDYALLNSLTDLQETFGFFFESGSAAERYFANADIYQTIIAAADKLQQKQYSVGGNAALMAYKMAQLTDDVEILMIGPVGPKVHSLMPTKVTIPESGRRDKDEIHLIMEYAKDERWGALTTPIATRFITSHDIANAELDGLDVFASSVRAFQPNVVMFSGLHLLDSSTVETQNEKVSALIQEFAKFPPNVPIHLELASMANMELVHLIATKVFPFVHSLGLNEQELCLVSRSSDGPHQDLVADEQGYIEIGAVADIVYWILTSLAKGQRSLLTRIHFHSLTFHIVATLSDDWNNNAAAVGAGTQIAGQQACEDVPINPTKVDLRIPKAFSLSVEYPLLRKKVVILDPNDPVVTWQRGRVMFYFSPVLVCKNPGKTVGLGDAISATAMVYTQYTRSN